MKKIVVFLFSLAVSVTASHADWTTALGGLLHGSTNAPSGTNANAAVAALSTDQVVGGLKDALGNGLQHAISQLGHDGGFLTNLNVKIPLPEKPQYAEKALRAVKQD